MTDTPDEPSSPTSSMVGTAIMVVLHGLAWLALAVYLIAYVPRNEKIFREFGMTLPWVTEIVLEVSHWLVSYWYVLAALLVVFLVVDGVILFILRRGTSVRNWLGWVWFLVMLVFPIGSWAMAVAGVGRAYEKLIEGLLK